jgi:hypothetical protein
VLRPAPPGGASRAAIPFLRSGISPPDQKDGGVSCPSGSRGGGQSQIEAIIREETLKEADDRSRKVIENKAGKTEALDTSLYIIENKICYISRI